MTVLRKRKRFSKFKYAVLLGTSLTAPPPGICPEPYALVYSLIRPPVDFFQALRSLTFKKLNLEQKKNGVVTKCLKKPENDLVMSTINSS